MYKEPSPTILENWKTWNSLNLATQENSRNTQGISHLLREFLLSCKSTSAFCHNFFSNLLLFVTICYLFIIRHLLSTHKVLINPKFSGTTLLTKLIWGSLQHLTCQACKLAPTRKWYLSVDSLAAICSPVSVCLACSLFGHSCRFVFVWSQLQFVWSAVCLVTVAVCLAYSLFGQSCSLVCSLFGHSCRFVFVWSQLQFGGLQLQFVWSAVCLVTVAVCLACSLFGHSCRFVFVWSQLQFVWSAVCLVTVAVCLVEPNFTVLDEFNTVLTTTQQPTYLSKYYMVIPILFITPWNPDLSARTYQGSLPLC